MSAASQSADLDVVRANKVDLLERLADDLAHEIKNPLHSMVINLEVLKRRAARPEGTDPDELLRYVGVLESELDRVHQRVELLLRMARPDRGREPVPLSDVLAELLELVELDCRKQRIELEYEPAAHAARVRVPAVLAHQTLLTLVLDTLDALEAGDTLRLRVEPADGTLRIAAHGERGAGERPTSPLARTAEGVGPVSELEPAARAEVARSLARSLGAELELAGALGADAGADDASAPGFELLFALPGG